MTYDLDVQTALADARSAAMTPALHPDTSPPDPDAGVRDVIPGLAPVAPSVGVAAALLNVCAIELVPVDRESLAATAAPLTTLSAVEAHYRTHLADGVAVQAGAQRNGTTVFALRGTVAALREWLADVGAEDVTFVNEYGTASTSRTYRAVSPFVEVAWSPPPRPARSVVVFGAGQMVESASHITSDRADREAALAANGWLCWTAGTVWTAAPDRGHRLVVKSRKLSHGVSVIGDGELVPWHVRRPDGWTCTAPNMPLASDQPLSGWLVDAIGGKWVPAA